MSVFMKRDRFSLNEKPYFILRYIESTGYEYINTGFKPNQNTRLTLEMDLLSRKSIDTSQRTVFLFGCRHSATSNLYQVYITDETTFYDGYNKKNTTATIDKGNNNFLIDKNKTKTLINDIQLNHTAATYQVDYDLILFGANTAGSVDARRAIGRVYSCKIYDNDILVRDYIPVKMKESGEIGLWDKANNVFYPNAGTGKFNAGEVAA